MIIEAKQFNLSNSLFGKISSITHDEHLKLYNGYVNNANLILNKIKSYTSSPDNNYELGELYRRFSFEYNGIKNHECYFEQISDPGTSINSDTSLYKLISEQWGSFENWKSEFIQLAKTRGMGWAILYYDLDRRALYNIWVDEQHLGHLNSCQFIYGIDLWEHSYVCDYLPSGKGDYINDYINSTNWDVVCARFAI